MAESTTLARPYAVAAYKRAKETGTADRWSESFAFLSAVMSDERMKQAAANPKGKREDFAAAFVELCGEHLDTEAENFVRILIRNRRLDLIKQIAEIFEQNKAEDEGYIDADVYTAFALDDDEWNSLAAMLERVLKKKPRLRVFIDKRLIGGVYIRAGDRVIDASVRGRVERLAKRLWN